MSDLMRSDLRLAAEVVREDKQYSGETGRNEAVLDRTATLLERLADATEMPAQFYVYTINVPDGSGFDVWVRNDATTNSLHALVEAAGWTASGNETAAPPKRVDQPSDFELVLEAAERRARELLDQAGKLQEPFASETLADHYQPLRAAIDAFRNDSVGAELSRAEADMLEIHDALVEAGLPGAMNAASIIERISSMEELIAVYDAEKQAAERGPEKLLLIVGSPAEGFQFHGPYADGDDVDAEHADLRNTYWWLVELQPPIEKEQD